MHGNFFLVCIDRSILYVFGRPLRTNDDTRQYMPLLGYIKKIQQNTFEGIHTLNLGGIGPIPLLYYVCYVMYDMFSVVIGENMRVECALERARARDA